jgi:hypothetical protein
MPAEGRAIKEIMKKIRFVRGTVRLCQEHSITAVTNNPVNELITFKRVMRVKRSKSTSATDIHTANHKVHLTKRPECGISAAS